METLYAKFLPTPFVSHDAMRIKPIWSIHEIKKIWKACNYEYMWRLIDSGNISQSTEKNESRALSCNTRLITEPQFERQYLDHCLSSQAFNREIHRSCVALNSLHITSCNVRALNINKHKLLSPWSAWQWTT